MPSARAGKVVGGASKLDNSSRLAANTVFRDRFVFIFNLVPEFRAAARGARR